MAAFLVKGEQGGHVNLKGTPYGLDKSLGFHGELSDFIDDQDFAMVLGMVDGRKGNAIQFFGVNSIAKDTETESMFL